MKIIICDNNTTARDSLELQIKQTDDKIEIIKFSDCAEADRYMHNRNNEVDAVFMDIEFEEDNCEGINSAAALLRDFPQLKVIFYTGYAEKYIEEIFLGLPGNNLYGVLKKPSSINTVREYIKKLEESDSESEKRYLIFKDTEKGYVNIDTENILYAFSFKRVANICMSDGETYSGYIKLCDLFSTLNKISADFYYCHKSYVINMKKVTSIPLNENAVIIGSHRIPLSGINGTAVAEKKKHIIMYSSEN